MVLSTLHVDWGWMALGSDWSVLGRRCPWARMESRSQLQAAPPWWWEGPEIAGIFVGRFAEPRDPWNISWCWYVDREPRNNQLSPLVPSTLTDEGPLLTLLPAQGDCRDQEITAGSGQTQRGKQIGLRTELLLNVLKLAYFWFEFLFT